MSKIGLENPAGRKAYVITGPTSGLGLATAFEVAKHGTVVLVGLNGSALFVGSALGPAIGGAVLAASGAGALLPATVCRFH